MGTGKRPIPHTNCRPEGLCLKGGSRNVPGGGVHGLLDETDQTRGAAASDQGAFHGRAAIIERGKRSEGHDSLAGESDIGAPDPRVSEELQTERHRDAGRLGSG